MTCSLECYYRIRAGYKTVYDKLSGNMHYKTEIDFCEAAAGKPL